MELLYGLLDGLSNDFFDLDHEGPAGMSKVSDDHVPVRGLFQFGIHCSPCAGKHLDVIFQQKPHSSGNVFFFHGSYYIEIDLNVKSFSSQRPRCRHCHRSIQPEFQADQECP